MSTIIDVDGDAAADTTSRKRRASNATAIANRSDIQPPATPGAAALSVIERIMTDPNASVERANQAFDFFQKVSAAEARKAFDAAMADAKAEIPPIVKNRVVEFATDKGLTSYRHEDLAGIARVIDPILSKHGLSYRFRTTSNPNEPICVTCIVSHRLGYSEENSLTAGRDESGRKNSIQAIGSTITYLQRYTLKAALGLSASHDDDGRAASEHDDGPITSEQVDELIALADEVRADKAKFCKFYKIDSFADIRASKFEAAKAALNAKRRAAK
jgi:hypothetical protein